MTNKSCFCQNPDKKEIIVTKLQNFDAEIRAFLRPFAAKKQIGQKKGQIGESAQNIQIEYITASISNNSPSSNIHKSSYD